MSEPWSWFVVETLLSVAVGISTLLTVFILTLPTAHSHFEPGYISEEDFTEDDKLRPDRSGWSYFQTYRDVDEKLKTEATVQVLVLGDIGRSPRMQYHALSIASHGGRIDLIGYSESEIHPDVQASRFINVVPIQPFPKYLQTSNKLLFLLVAPLKVLWQVWSVYYALGYRTKACKWMLVQNPPSIPTLAVAQFICFFRKTRLIIDWHNFGYSILALRLGPQHPLVRISEWYEGVCSRKAAAHFAVTDAMAKVLKRKWGIEAMTLHDRPPSYFQPIAQDARTAFLRRLSDTSEHAEDIEMRRCRLIVSSTSWTPDEDFSILLDALVRYSAAGTANDKVPKILAIITGKGPQKEHYLSRIRQLNLNSTLSNVKITTAWLSTEDYASLLASADLGISLHTSSSGVDLPMKVVDMFGTGLPVAGWSKFEAWPELVQERVNGRGFDSPEGLADILLELFSGDGSQLEHLRKGALKECSRRWDDEWMPVAGRLFQLKS